MRPRHFSRSIPFFRLFVLTFVSSLLASAFLLMLVLNQKFYNSFEMNFLGNEINKMFKNDAKNVVSIDFFKDRIKHIKKSETTEDHCVLYDFVKADMKKPTTYEPISLALHSTINYASYVIQHANTWNDFISYSLYLYPGNEAIIFLLKQLHFCHSKVKSKVSIHLVWNRGFFQSDCFNPELLKILQKLKTTEIKCSDFSIPKFIMNLKSLPNQIEYYPINIMRNEARRGAPTKIHLIADIETKFSIDFAKTVQNLTQNLLNKKLGKAILVFRRFEMYPDIPFPKSPAEVYDLIKDKKLFHFHWYFFTKGHQIPNLKEWFDYSISNSTINFINQTYLIPEWEPQFIMLDRDPYHLEFVPTRFNDHQTLCNQLCRAGYNFLVMSHVFNIHTGIKQNSTPIETAISKLGKKKSPRFLKRFNTFLDKYFPKSLNDKKCPRIKF